MRREGYIIEEIIDYSNMSESFDEVLRGKKRKRSRQGRYLLAHREEVIKELTEQIANGSFRVSGYRERTIHEYGKERNLQILSMKDRIGVHAIMSVVDRHLQRRYIRTTAASIKERGTHDLMKVIRQDMQHDPEGTLYAYKFDIRHFYENVRQDFAMWCYRRVFKDQKLLVMLESFVTMLDRGISFGLRSSQATGNLLLSVFLATIWQESTESMVRNIFGESSAEYKELHELFHPMYFCMPSGGFNERMDYHRQRNNRLENVFSKLSGYKTVLMMRVASSNEDQSFSAIKEVVRICSRFSNVTRSMRKRYSNRKPLIIQDEYDVQYLLKSLLSICFDDIRPEETTPSCAGSYSRMDFLLKAEQIAIETKMTRENLADKELSKQLIQDIAQYQR